VSQATPGDVSADVDAVTTTSRTPATEQEYREQVGRRLRLQRIGLDLSQHEVASAAGVTRNFVSAVERGTQGLDAWRLRQLADALGVTLCWLLDCRSAPDER
jgi:ribosome-binding protein aMBF1 (putative translation factor)